MEIGDVVLFRPQSSIGKVIARLTRSEYSHVGLVIGDNLILEANRFIKVRVRDFEYDENQHDIYRLKLVTKEMKRYIVVEGLGMTGMGYDYFQILGWLLRLVFQVHRANLFNRANLLICSELIDKTFYLAGVPRRGDRRVGDVTPNDLLHVYNFVKVRPTDA